MFNVLILHPKKILFEGEAESVFLQGDEGEFEVLSYHSPVISVLQEGAILIDGHKCVPVKKGLARFYNNEMVILVEQ